MINHKYRIQRHAKALMMTNLQSMPINDGEC